MKEFSIIILLLMLGCDNTSLSNSSGQTTSYSEMVFIPSKDSSFIMGSDDGGSSEYPAHKVSFSYNYYISNTEITQGEFNALMSDSLYGYNSFKPDSFIYGMGDKYPIYEINYYDAAMFCNARSKKEGYDTVYIYDSINGIPGNDCDFGVGGQWLTIDLTKIGYRLPTGAEWEYACKAGSKTEFYWGATYNNYPSNYEDTLEISKYCIWAINSSNLGETHPSFGANKVGTKLPNKFGLYDMIGNVSEWIHDRYSTSYDIADSLNSFGPSSGTYGCLRSGSWEGEPDNWLSATCKFRLDRSVCFRNSGFRVALLEEVPESWK